MEFELVSMGSVLKIYDDRLVIGQKGVTGFLARGLSGEKTIYYRDITSIQFKETGLTAGYLEFSFPGSRDSRGLLERGENKFVFVAQVGFGGGKELNKKAADIKQYVEKRVNAMNNPVSEFSAADELLKFKTLLDSGVISTEEFEKKKSELLR